MTVRNLKNSFDGGAPGKPADFRQAIAAGDNAAVAAFLDRYPEAVNRAWEGSLTPLMAAVGCKKLAMVQLLLDRGADVHQKDFNNWTALMVAAVYKDKAIMELLLEKGAEIEVKNSDGGTIRGYASRDAEANELLEHWPEIQRTNLLDATDCSRGLKRNLPALRPLKISRRPGNEK